MRLVNSYLNTVLFINMESLKPTWKEAFGFTEELVLSILLMLSAAFTGTVLFSTTTLCPSVTAALIDLAADSTNLRSAALPCKYETTMLP